MRRAFMFSTGERYVAILANFVTLAVVSRVLTPSEIGVAVVGMAVAQMLQTLREFATTNYIVQRPDLSDEDVRTTSTVFLLLSAGIALALYLSSTAIAASYEDVRLESYLKIGALCLVGEAVSAPIQALYRRDMRFDLLAAINVAGTVVGNAATLILAVLGWSYLSFALGWLATTVVMMVLALILYRDPSIFRPSLASWSQLFAFGSLNGANVMLAKMFETVPYLVLGRMLSFDAAALYNRSATVAQLPDKLLLGGLSSILLPAFAADLRNGRNLRENYLRGVELITAVQWPALICLSLLAYPIVRVLLGEQWTAVVPLVQVMALAGLAAFSAEFVAPMLMAVGAFRDLLVRGLIIWPTSAALLVAAAAHSLEAAAWSWMIIVPFQTFVSIAILRRHMDMSWASIASSPRNIGDGERH